MTSLDAAQREQRRRELEAELGEPITLDGLTPSWQIFQRKNGHRHSVDDLLTAWYAAEKAGPVSQILDLGTGIGTVGLLVLSRLSDHASFTGIEAQEISFRFLLENVRLNGVSDRSHVHHADLRNVRLSNRFPLVTGSPPYFPAGAGIISSDSQRAHARFELRGDVCDYLRAATTHLERDGLFVFCFPHAQRERAVNAIRENGFRIDGHRAVVPRKGIVPLFSLFACRKGAFAEIDEGAFVVRDEHGRVTPEMQTARASFGWASGA